MVTDGDAAGINGAYMRYKGGKEDLVYVGGSNDNFTAVKVMNVTGLWTLSV